MLNSSLPSFKQEGWPENMGSAQYEGHVEELGVISFLFNQFKKQAFLKLEGKKLQNHD